MIKKRLAVTVVREGVELERGEPCLILVTLAAQDADSHIEVMRIPAGMFVDSDYIEKVATAADADEVYRLFVDYSPG